MKTQKTIFPAWRHLLLLCALTLCLLLTMTGCKPLGKVNPFDYISLTYDGYQGNGTAAVDFDCEELVVSLLGKAPETYEEFGQWLLAYSQYEEGIRIDWEPQKGLSNGDKVRVIVSTSGMAAKKVKSGSREYTVSGLPEAKTVDVFQNVGVSFEGIVGDITHARVERLSEDAFLKKCAFHVEPEFNIHNGDTVTLTITNSEALAKEFLFVPKETEKTFAVSGLSEYLTDADLLPEDKIRDIIPRHLQDSRKEANFRFSYSEPEYYKTYFCVAKENCFAEDKNRLEVFVCFDEYMNGEYRRTKYVPLTFRNLILEPDGMVELEYENGISPAFYDDADSIVEKLEKTYEVEEVYIEY